MHDFRKSSHIVNATISFRTHIQAIIVVERDFANILITKCGCGHKFYKLIGFANFLRNYFLESYLNCFLGTVSRTTKPKKVDCLACKTTITK